MFRYGNPSVSRWARRCGTGNLAVECDAATYRGVIGKTALLVAITIVSAIATMFATTYGIFKFAETLEISDIAVIGFIVGVAVAVVLMIVCSIGIAVSPKTAKVFGPIYAIIQGAFLGFIAAFLDMILPFVTVAAMLGTVIVFVVCMLLYRVIGVRIKSNFVRVLAISLMCFVLAEVIVVPIMLFAQIEGFYNALIWIQAISTFICIVFASITIIYDLQSIDYMVQVGADRQYEWPVAFSLTTSLVYLYLQILQLLLRIFALFATRKK